MFNNGNDLVMPVAPAYGGYGGGNGSFFGGDGIWAVIILALLFNGGFGGFGGYGGMMGMGMADGMFLYPWMNQADITTSGFQNQMLQSSIQGLQSSVTSGFGDVQTALCGGFAGVNASINNAQNAVSQQLYTNQIADLERSFASQTAVTQGMNNIGMNLQNCCCENRAGLADLKYTVATENCADRQAVSDGIRDILSATQAQTQAILNQLCSDKIEAKNDTIAQLRSELMYARGQASQDVQTATIQAGQRALANEVEQYVAPKPIPAYTVQNPNCCFNSCGCGNF